MGGFDINKYEIVRFWVIVSDGICIFILVIYRKDFVKLDGIDLLFFFGYGFYEVVLFNIFDFFFLLEVVFVLVFILVFKNGV